MKKHNLAIDLALLLAGCSVTPDYEIADTIDINQVYVENHNVDSAHSANSHWWQEFNDAQLDQLVKDVQSQNLTIQVAAQRIKMAQSYESSISSLKLPTISLGASAFSYRLSEQDPLLGGVVSGISVPTNSPIGAGQNIKLIDKDQNGLFVGANISWEMDMFGKLDALSQAANIRTEQATIMQSGITTLITADLVNNYLQYRGAQERLVIAERNYDEQQQTVEMVQTLVKSGYGSELDLATANAALAAISASRTVFKTAEKIHLNRIATLLGQHTSEVTDRFVATPLPKVTEKIPVGIPSDLLKQRYDIALAEREMAAINQELGASIAARYPSFYLTATPGSLVGNFDELLSTGSSAWMASLGTNWNIYDGGRGKALVEMQESRFEAASLKYQQAVNDAFNEVETALITYSNNITFHQQITEAAKQSEIAVEKANHLYKAGLIDYIQVLDAQRQDNILQDAVIVSRLNIANNVILLNKALGGNWSVDKDA